MVLNSFSYARNFELLIASSARSSDPTQIWGPIDFEEFMGFFYVIVTLKPNNSSLLLNIRWVLENNNFWFVVMVKAKGHTSMGFYYITLICSLSVFCYTNGLNVPVTGRHLISWKDDQSLLRYVSAIRIVHVYFSSQRLWSHSINLKVHLTVLLENMSPWRCQNGC